MNKNYENDSTSRNLCVTEHCFLWYFRNFAKKKIGAAVPSVNLISLNYFLIMNLMRKKTDIHIKSIADFVVSWNCTYEVNGEKSDCD